MAQGLDPAARERFFRAVLDDTARAASLGAARDGEALSVWLSATDRLLAACGDGGADLLAALAAAWRASDAPGARDGEASTRALARATARRATLERLVALDDARLAAAVAGSTEASLAALGTLREEPPTPLGARVRALFPELAALAVPPAREASIEHERAADGPGRALPLVDHLERTLERKLLGLERHDRGRFQRDEALSTAAFEDEARRVALIRDRAQLDIVRLALLHLDFAKGGTTAQREAWRALRVDVTVHNVAAREILERAGAPSALAALGTDPARRLLLALVESHGLTGQAVRGETPLVIFAPLVRYLRAERRRDEIADAVACLHAINICDTAAVREGLLDDALRAEMIEVESRVEALARAGDASDERAIEAELIALEERLWRERLPEATAEARARSRLADRLARLRKGRILGGEPRAESERAVERLTPGALARLPGLLAICQLWYAEAATSALSAEGQLKVLALGIAAAARRPGVDVGRPYHVSLLPLVAKLHRGADPAVAYRVRLVEALLAPLSIEQILDGVAPATALGTFDVEIGGTRAVALAFEESPEAAALLTLLPIYERKSSAAFHATLKALCDLYGLRKDEFDRVSNETLYLAHMNSARSDKARMLDHARPGRIVEVGPGGGIVLDLLEQRFPGSEVIGIDVSRMVIEALEARRRAEGRRWRVIEADAFRLPEVVGAAGVDTVVYCSVLHEIYSYVEYARDAGGERGRFRLEAVRDLLRASWRSLVAGGRLVIRDGVMPPPGVRILRFLTPDARELFDLFVKQFEARKIVAEPAGEPDRVRLSSADAMEFLFKLTWGAESFPYEIREQYGVLPYEAYRDAILGWLGPTARWVPLSVEERSYLQPGYRTGLAGRVELLDAGGDRVELPDSNCLLVFEKVR